MALKRVYQTRKGFYLAYAPWAGVNRPARGTVSILPAMSSVILGTTRR